MLKYKTIVGNAEISYSTDGLFHEGMKNICRAGELLGKIPHECNLCKGKDINFFHRSPGGNDYYGVRCQKCGAEFNFHQKKTGGFYITPEDKFTIYDQGKQIRQEDVKDNVTNDEFF